ncbi:carboxypeptidase-like regulatory domain-containing protein [Planctomicrobium sp. SH668]|uniref:carboxypeptidase-like regulatory domain-containing protein n=1 Tax=Planctomicrobium sp. SH668 TaxID=3448126 RepID=UPI003F5B1F2D
MGHTLMIRASLVSLSMRHIASRKCLTLLLLASLALGCSQKNDDLATVTGTVTLDSAPLKDAFIVFTPVQSGTTSYGKTDAQGKYAMVFSESQSGAWLGENKVQISTADVGGGDRPGAAELVPDVYNKKTTLSATVEKRHNEFHFALKSKEGKIRKAAIE